MTTSPATPNGQAVNPTSLPYPLNEIAHPGPAQQTPYPAPTSATTGPSSGQPVQPPNTAALPYPLNEIAHPTPPSKSLHDFLTMTSPRPGPTPASSGDSTGEPVMQFPPNTNPATRQSVQTAMDRLWAALGKSAPITTDPAHVPAGVAKSDPGIGGYGNVVNGMQTVRDQFVSAESQLARLISESATNTDLARKAILDCVDDFNTATIDVDATSPTGQKQLLTRIQIALDKAQLAVKNASSSSPSGLPPLPQDKGPNPTTTTDPTEPDSDPPGSSWQTDPTSPPPAGISPTDPDSGSDSDPYSGEAPTSPLDAYRSPGANQGSAGMNPMMGPGMTSMMNPYGNQMNPMMNNALSSLPGLIQALSTMPKDPGSGTAGPTTPPAPATPTPDLAPTPTTTPDPVPANAFASPDVTPTTPTVPTSPGTPVTPTSPQPPTSGSPQPVNSPQPGPGTNAATGDGHTTPTAPGPNNTDPQVTLPDGSQQTAPNAQAAQAVRNALANTANAGDAAQSAYAGTGVTMPAGHDPGTAIDPADMAPGDVAVWGDHTAIIAAPGQAIDHGKLRPIGDMMGDGTDFKGLFRPTAPGPANPRPEPQ